MRRGLSVALVMISPLRMQEALRRRRFMQAASRPSHTRPKKKVNNAAKSMRPQRAAMCMCPAHPSLARRLMSPPKIKGLEQKCKQGTRATRPAPPHHLWNSLGSARRPPFPHGKKKTKSQGKMIYWYNYSPTSPSRPLGPPLKPAARVIPTPTLPPSLPLAVTF